MSSKQNTVYQGNPFLSHYYWIIAAILSGILSLHSQSFWIDEGTTALLGMQPDLPALWHRLTAVNGSEVQMPLYTLYAWLWERLFGCNEYILRASNLPWLIMGAWILRKNIWAVTLFAVSPFVVYYVGEYRPYAMQIAASLWMVSILFKMACLPFPALNWQAKENGNARFPYSHVFFASSLLLCSISLSCLPWVLCAFLGFLILLDIWNKPRLLFQFLIKNVGWSIPFIMLGGYYVFVLSGGSSPSLNKSSVFTNLASSFYEVGGLAGLGPSRYEIRQDTSAVLDYLTLIIPASLIIGTASFLSLYDWFKTRGIKAAIAILAASCLPLLSLCLLNIITGFRFSGRHCAPLFPYFLLLLSCYFIRPGESRKQAVLKKSLGTATIIVFLISCLQIRFNPIHERENYREAVKHANTLRLKGKNVVWIASSHTAEFYHLSPNVLHNKSISSPDYVIYSRPENFDGTNRIPELIKQRNYEQSHLCTGFDILVKREQ